LLDAPYVHLFIAQRPVNLEDAGVLNTVDAVRLMPAGGRRVTSFASPSAKILIWETTKDLEI
jgi:hypothetical protein